MKQFVEFKATLIAGLPSGVIVSPSRFADAYLRCGIKPFQEAYVPVVSRSDCE
jgi:hypothetical protein